LHKKEPTKKINFLGVLDFENGSTQVPCMCKTTSLYLVLLSRAPLRGHRKTESERSIHTTDGIAKNFDEKVGEYLQKKSKCDNMIR
jgi:hypothetical protein